MAARDDHIHNTCIWLSHFWVLAAKLTCIAVVYSFQNEIENAQLQCKYVHRYYVVSIY